MWRCWHQERMMSPMWRLVVPLVFLLRDVAAYDYDTNYMSQSGKFASISTIEDMLFPESMMIKKLEKYHDRLDSSLQMLKRYLEAWRELDLEQDITDDTSSRKRYLDTQKTSFRIREANLTNRLLKSKEKVRNGRLRGDNAPIKQGEVTYPDNGDDYAEKETHKLEKELDDVRQNYEWLTSEFMMNEANESSSAVSERRQRTPPGGGVQHPIDAYLLMKRLTVNWAAVKTNLMDLQSNTTAVFDDLDAQRDRLRFPTTADLHGAAVALVKLQDVYDLNMADLGAGIIPGKVAYDNKDVRSIGQLRAGDYIELGRQAYLLDYDDRAIKWFKLAVKASESEQLVGEELDVISQLKETIEKNESASLEDKYISKKKKKKKGKKVTKKRAFKLHRMLTLEEDAVHYRLLCRGEKFLSPAYESTLFCRLERLKSAYLLLMPLKMEELHHSPRIVLFHSFLTDSQSNYIVKRAKPTLHLATHGSPYGKETSMIRVCMTGRLTEDITTQEDPLAEVTRKIQEATDMEVRKPEDAELYKAANYGIGGLHDTHHDYSMQDSDGRIGTFLIYLSNVAAGGATVFTRLGVRAEPERGTALFWYNLFTEGHGDHLTYHGACPVLHGSKWITTKWIKYNSQFLKRPCGLRPETRFQYP